MQKKANIIFMIMFILVLSLSYTSAGILSDFFGKTMGNAINHEEDKIKSINKNTNSNEEFNKIAEEPKLFRRIINNIFGQESRNQTIQEIEETNALREENLWIVSQDGSGEFDNIQDAIDNPNLEQGDRILVRSGIYEINNQITISGKINLTLEGENKYDTIIRSTNPNSNFALVISRPVSNPIPHGNIIIRNFNFQNFTKGNILVSGDFISSIGTSADYVQIENNIFDLASYSPNSNLIKDAGVFFEVTSHDTFIHNKFINVPGNLGHEAVLVNIAAFIYQHDYNTIKYNYFKSGEDSINFQLSDGEGNVVSNNYFAYGKITDGTSQIKNLPNYIFNNEFVGIEHLGVIIDTHVGMWHVPSSPIQMYHNNLYNYDWYLASLSGNYNDNYWDKYNESENDIYLLPSFLGQDIFDYLPSNEERGWLGEGGTIISFAKDEETAIVFTSFISSRNLEDLFGGYISMVDYIEELGTNKKFNPKNGEYTLDVLDSVHGYKIIPNEDFSFLFKGNYEIRDCLIAINGPKCDFSFNQESNL